MHEAPDCPRAAHKCSATPWPSGQRDPLSHHVLLDEICSDSCVEQHLGQTMEMVILGRRQPTDSLRCLSHHVLPRQPQESPMASRDSLLSTRLLLIPQGMSRYTHPYSFAIPGYHQATCSKARLGCPRPTGHQADVQNCP